MVDSKRARRCPMWNIGDTARCILLVRYMYLGKHVMDIGYEERLMGESDEWGYVESSSILCNSSIQG